MRFTLGLLATGLAATLAAGCSAGEAEPERSPERTDGAGEWRRLPDAPLSPRDDAVVVGVGRRMVVVGGWEFLCPPGGDCAAPPGPLLRDGAVYDAQADAWTEIAPAPVGLIREEHAVAALGGTAYVLTSCGGRPGCGARPRLLSYDLGADRWTDHGVVPGRSGYRHVTTVGRTLLLSSGSDEGGEVADLLFDPARATWSELPDDPLPRVYDRFMVPAAGSLVLTASSIASVDTGDAAKLVARYDLRTARWTRLPSPPGQGYQLVPTDRGPLLLGHFIESSGWVLDPATWRWSELGPADGTHLGGVLDGERAIYDVPNSVGEMTATERLQLYDVRADDFLTVPPLLDRADVSHDSSAALGRDLFVYGGQRWTGDAMDGEGTLVGDAWLWEAPR